MRYHEPAICLRTTDYSETSQVVHFMTRGAGVVGLLAKGSKRAKSKSGGTIDLLSEGDLVFTSSSSGTLGTLIEFSESISRAELRKDARRLFTAQFMLEMVGDTLAENDPHPEVFDLLHNALARLGQADAPVSAVLAYFQWRLLRRIGLLGDLRACVSCGQGLHRPMRDVFFSSRLGGMLCRNCEAPAVEKYRLDDLTIEGAAILEAAEAGRKVTLPDHAAVAISRLLTYHIREQLGKPLRMARYVLGHSTQP